MNDKLELIIILLFSFVLITSIITYVNIARTRHISGDIAEYTPISSNNITMLNSNMTRNMTDSMVGNDVSLYTML